jgi:hypothetical protein
MPAAVRQAAVVHLAQQVREADDMAQRRAQVVRHRIREAFQFAVDAPQFQRQLRVPRRAAARCPAAPAKFGRDFQFGRATARIGPARSASSLETLAGDSEVDSDDSLVRGSPAQRIVRTTSARNQIT